jgi:hypothetical protein
MPDESYTPGTLHGVAHPAPHLKASMRVLFGLGTTVPLETAAQGATAILGLAQALEESAAQSRNEDGTIDYKVQAAHILKALKGTT